MVAFSLFKYKIKGAWGSFYYYFTFLSGAFFRDE